MDRPEIDIHAVSSPNDRRTFISLPWEVHAGHRAWVPPLYREEKRYFDESRNPAAAYCCSVMALAYRRGIPCGRVMGIVNRRHNAKTGKADARFGCLECPNDPAIARALLEFTERWARTQGMTRIVGPLGFTDQDPEGFLVEGFDREPTIATYANFPYMAGLLEACGYVKEVDYVVYRVPVPAALPPAYRRVLERAQRGGRVKVHTFRRRRELKPYIRRVIQLMNDTFDGLYGYVPLDEREMAEAGKRFLPVVDPRFVKFATVDGKDAAFILAMPNIDEGLRRANGRLFPGGFLSILASARRSRQLDLLAGGVRQEYRSYGLAVLGLALVLESARGAGFEVVDSHLELESNARMRAEMERLGGILTKRYRVFQKVF